MVSNKVKGILSLIGGFSLHFMNGSLYTWAAINSYFASYLRHQGNPNVELKDVFYMMPSIFMVQYCFMTAGVKIGDKLGVRISTLIGVLLMTGSYVLLLFLTQFVWVILAMGIFGCGNGIANLSVIKNCWKYLPNNKGLVNGIIIGGLGLSSAALNPLADFIINPKKIPPDDDGYYPTSVTNNIPTYLYVIIGIFIVLSLSAVCFTCPFKEEEALIDNNDENDQEEPIILPEIKDEHSEQTIKKAFFSIPNLQLGIFCFTGPFFCFLLTNTNRTFGNIHHIDQSALQFMAFFYSLINGSARFAWGWLLDKFSFKFLMYIVLFFELVISASVSFIADYTNIYLIENFIIALCLSGTFTMITPTFNLVFGFKNGAQMYGLTGLLVGLASFLGPVLTSIFIKTNDDYMIIYLTGSAFVVIDIITLITFKECPYTYGVPDIDNNKMNVVEPLGSPSESDNSNAVPPVDV